MFSARDAFEVDGILLGGTVAVFSADTAPLTGDYSDTPLGSQCIVPGVGVFTKYGDGSWLRSVDDPSVFEELILYNGTEPELCFFSDSIAKVRV